MPSQPFWASQRVSSLLGFGHLGTVTHAPPYRSTDPLMSEKEYYTPSENKMPPTQIHMEWQQNASNQDTHRVATKCLQPRNLQSTLLVTSWWSRPGKLHNITIFFTQMEGSWKKAFILKISNYNDWHHSTALSTSAESTSIPGMAVSISIKGKEILPSIHIVYLFIVKQKCMHFTILSLVYLYHKCKVI